jgi:hypothetical protein
LDRLKNFSAVLCYQVDNDLRFSAPKGGDA